jgi:hypothetical protein
MKNSAFKWKTSDNDKCKADVLRYNSFCGNATKTSLHSDKPQKTDPDVKSGSEMGDRSDASKKIYPRADQQ